MDINNLSGIKFINNCGRINIPFRIRRVLGINEKTPIKVSIENNKIVLEKVECDEP